MTERAKKLLLLYYKQSRKIRRVSGLPPLTFKAKKAGTLKNYRIYGQTVDGESVGDRTGNLFGEGDLFFSTVNTNYTTMKFFNKTYSNNTYTITLKYNGAIVAGHILIDKPFNEGIYNSYYKAYYADILSSRALTFTVEEDFKIGIAVQAVTAGAGEVFNIMLNTGSEPLPYEPYGYRVPVTVTNGTDTQTTNIYLPEPLTKSGDNADYIDYATQKRHNSDGTESSVTLPEIAVTADSNTLTVGTEVQPSGVEIKGRIKAAGGD